MKNLDSHIEAVLFLKGEPMNAAELAKIFEVKEKEVEEAIDLLREKLSGRGVCLMEKDDSIMLATSPESSVFTKTLIEEEFDSQPGKAALETLSVIVYRGSVTRADIDYIRGVNSSFILRNLLIRGFVERTQNPRDNRSFIYKPSFYLLQYLGARNINDLPEYGVFNEKMENFIEDGKRENDNNTDNI